MTEPGFELTIHEAPTTPTTVVDLIRLAIEQKVPVEAIERLQALHERVSDRAAAAEFAQALARFQAACPPITKNRKVEVTSERKGTKFEYPYADLVHIVRTIGPALQAEGFYYNWDSKIEGDLYHCTCKLRHVNGHFETSTFVCPVATNAAMSPQQKYGSAMQYARRLSLIQVTGITTTDQEDEEVQDPTLISDEQLQDLEALIQELGINRLRVLRFAGVPELREIRASNYNDTVVAVRDYAKKQSEKPK